MTLFEEAEKLGMCGVFYQYTLRSHIYGIADELVDNYEKRVGKNGKQKAYKRQYIPLEIEQGYREIISCVLSALKPYYAERMNEYGHMCYGFKYEKRTE